jgi:carbohydrate-selective porin OprB
MFNDLNRNNLYSQLNKLNKEGKLPFKVKLKDMSYGDEYYHNETNTINFKIGGDEYEVGWYHITEDADDWAQAEAYNGDIFNKNGKNVNFSVIIEDLNNYQQIERDYQLNKLLND